MGTRSELVGRKGKKKGSNNFNFGVGVDVGGLGLRMQESSSCDRRIQAQAQAQHNCYYQESQTSLLLPYYSYSSSSPCCEKIGGGGGVGDCGFDDIGGSMFCNTSNQVACMSDIYDAVGAASGSGTGTNNSAAAVLLMSKSSLGPPAAGSFFHFNSSSSSSASASASGEMAAASMNVNVNANMNMRLPFTAAQLQELERQTLIYKLMVASAPIPHELLLPITKSSSRVSSSQPNLVQGQGSMELRLLTNNSSDPEPWRCRRTDGKKWRCSRDVAPDQKYCERHSHKSRPRSRKPVELPAHRINNNNNNNFNNQSVNTLNKLPYPKTYSPSSIASNEQLQQQQPWGLEWFMKGEATPLASSNSNREWLQNTSKSGDHHRQHLINSNSYVHLGGEDLSVQAQRLHDQYSYLLSSPKMVSHQAQTHETRHFIDAWSLGGGNMANEDRIGSNCFGSSTEKLPLSSLTLSMSGGSETIERTESSLMGSLGTMGSEREHVGTLKPHWMNHVSGVGSPPGGPLAEALCLGIASSVAKSDSNAVSPHGCSTSTSTSS